MQKEVRRPFARPSGPGPGGHESRSGLGLFLLGLLLRLVALPATGTDDTGEWKAWKACLVESGLATVYGPHDGKVAKLALRRSARATWCGAS